MPPQRGTKRAASESLPETAETTRQRATKTNCPAKTQTPADRARQAPSTPLGCDTAKLTLASQPLYLRSTGYGEPHIEDQSRVIKALRLLSYRWRTGTPILVPDIQTAPRQSAAGRIVDELFTGLKVDGRNWKCDVEIWTLLGSKTDRVLFWLIDEDKDERRWFASTVPSAQCDVAAAQRIGSDIASAANRWPGRVQAMSNEGVTTGLIQSSVASLILEVATRRQADGRRALLAPTSQAEADGYYIEWTASCIDPSTSRPWTLGSPITICLAAPFSTFMVPDVPDLQFVTKAEARSLAVQQVNGRGAHESIVPVQIPGISRTWTSRMDRRTAILQAEELARALVAIMDGMVIDKPSAKALVRHYTEEYSSPISKNTVFGLYGDLKLYDIWRDVAKRTYYLGPSKHVQKHIHPESLHFPLIPVKSLNQDRLVLVLDSLNQTWVMTGSFSEAWVAGAAGAASAEAAASAAHEGLRVQYLGLDLQSVPHLRLLQRRLSRLNIEFD
jgi:hypothetical protein